MCLDKLCYCYYYSLYPISSVGLATMLRDGQEIFIFSKIFGPCMGPTLSSIQWLSASPPHPLGMKRRWREVVRSSPCLIEVRNMWRYTSTLPCAVRCAEIHIQRHVSRHVQNKFELNLL